MPLNIKKYALDSNRYYSQEFKKTQIWLHHTVSNNSPHNVVNYWNQVQPNRHVATAYIIGRDGLIIQCFNEKFYANHIGVQHPNNNKIHKESIGIELVGWGPLKLENGVYKNVYGGVVPASEVTIYNQPFKNYKYYHKYTNAQLNATRDLLASLCDTYNIPKTAPLTLQEFVLNNDSLNLKPGIWVHVNARQDKSDVHPQPELLTMLAGLPFITGDVLPNYDNLISDGNPPTNGTPASKQKSVNKENVAQNPDNNIQQAPTLNDIEDPQNFEPSFSALFQQIEDNINNIEAEQVDVTWGMRSQSYEQSDWIGLRQFLLYLTSRYMPQSLFPFIELIPAYKINGSANYVSDGTVNKDLLESYSNIDPKKKRLIKDKLGSSLEKFGALGKYAKEKLELSLDELPPGFNSERWAANAALFNDNSKNLDLFNLDPFQESYSEIGKLSTAGKIIKAQRGYGVRIYSQAVLSPAAINGVPSKPGAIGFTNLSINSGATADNGLSVINMTLIDAQGNKFTDINSPWAFIFDVKSKTTFGDFYFRYGWQIRVPPTTDQDLKTNITSKRFWNHPGWKVFGYEIRDEIRKRILPGIDLLTLTQSSDFDSIFRSDIYDPETGEIVINKKLLENTQGSYLKLSIINPEIEVLDNGALSANLTFRTTGSLGKMCPIERAYALKNLVPTERTINLAELLIAIEYDNNANALFEIEDPAIVAKRLEELRTFNKAVRNDDAQQLRNLVKVVGPYSGGNRGGGINPNKIKIKISKNRAKELNSINESSKTILYWLNRVLLDNDCTLLTAGQGSGGSINASYVITTTQTIDEDINTLEEVDTEINLSIIRNNGQVVGYSGNLIDTDVFSYRFQGSLVTRLNVTKTDKPNALTNAVNFAVNDFLTNETTTQEEANRQQPLTIQDRKRNLLVLFSQMQNVEIECLCHPWLAPGQTIFVKGMGFYDGEYQILEIRHNLELHTFTSNIIAARILPIDSDQNKTNNKENALINGNNNFTTTVEQQSNTTPKVTVPFVQ